MYENRNLPSEIREKLAHIKVLITDVDGVLTDGGIILDDEGTEYKRFQVKDGQIIPFLKASGIRVGAVTGRNVEVVKKRCEQMAFDFHRHGVKNKYAEIRTLLQDLGLALKHCAYIGDDIIDLEILQNVGFSAAPADALPYVKERVDFVCSLDGGKGAFREVADTLLQAQGKFENLLKRLDLA